MDISVIIPVFNEEKGLKRLYDQLESVFSALAHSAEIIFVDDGSTDGSLDLLRSFQRKAGQTPLIRVVELSRNFGQHPAIIAGFSVATGRVLVTFDADLQTDPRDIVRLAGKIDSGYDFVGGIRVGRTDSFWSRRLPSLLLTRLLNAVTGKALKDYSCPLNALRREIALSMREYGEMQRFLKPLAVRLSPRITEIEIQYHPRLAGRSKYGMLSLVDLFFDFLTNFSRQLFQRVAIAGGAIAALSASIGMLYLLLRFPFGLLKEAIEPLQVLVVTGFLSGMQLLVLGVLGDFVIRIYRRMEPKPLYTIKQIY